MTSDVLGKGLPRLDATDKATGKAQYVIDLQMPGMLFGKILRSPHPHALIKSIDTSRAQNLDGVHTVLTGEDVPLRKFSFFDHLADKTMFCSDKVRYVGDEVAAVAAVDWETATRALELIEVDYEPLPAVFDPEEAMKTGSPLIHDGESNICFQSERVFGDPEQAFRECDYICEDRYVTSHVAHCCLESSNCIARWDPPDRLTVWTSSQAPHTQRQEVARILGMPAGRVRFLGASMGGGFGARLVMDMKLPIGAILSKKTGRPVKIVNTRSEEFATAKTRYGYTIYLKTGAKKDGTLLAREMRIVGDNGAYHDKGPSTLGLSSTVSGMMYNVPNRRFQGIFVYTNKQMGTAFRGFGNPQVTFAMETQLDALAGKIGMGPLELRLKNANQPGTSTPFGAEITSCGMTECMQSATAKAGWQDKRHQKGLKGIGLANVIHSGGGSRSYGYNATDAFLKISEEGMVTLITGAPDMGQGAHTALAQIAAEELGVPLDAFKVVSDDTDLTPYDLGACASRTTFICGNAALSAAKDAKREIVSVASEMMEANPKDIVLKKGKVSVKGSPEKFSHTFAELAEYAIQKKGEPISGRGRFVDKLPAGCTPEEAAVMNTPTFAFGAQVAEVEIDEKTGEVTLLKFVAAHDIGRIVNSHMAEGQVEGAVVQGIGYALMENMVFEGGRLLNDGFLDYKIPRITDIPSIETIFVETNDPAGPFGAKGIGEPGIVPTAPAIANAIFNASGIRVRRLPISPEEILEGLRKRKR